MTTLRSIAIGMAVLSWAIPTQGTDPTSNTAVVATQLAVPVGIPVAPFAPTYYSYEPTSVPAGKFVLSPDQEAAIVEHIVNRVAERLQAGSPPKASAEAQETNDADASPEVAARRVLTNRCAACHSEKSKVQTVVLTGDPQQLSRKLRQEVLLRVLSTDSSKRMPKNGPPLSESEFLALFRELVH